MMEEPGRSSTLLWQVSLVFLTEKGTCVYDNFDNDGFVNGGPCANLGSHVRPQSAAEMTVDLRDFTTFYGRASNKARQFYFSCFFRVFFRTKFVQATYVER